MNVSQLTGAQFFDARTFIGMSISSAAKLSGLNRNVISQFEKEKATLTSNEKKKLVSLYEERGYDFEQLESANEDTFESNIEDSKANLANAEPKEVGQRMIELMDDVSDLITSKLVTPTANTGLQFHADIEENNDTLSLLNDYQRLDKLITEHLASDKAGETKGKVGFFAEDGEARSDKLIGLMALQYMRTLAATDSELALLTLGDVAERDSDNYRLLKRLATVFDYNALKLDGVSSELVK